MTVREESQAIARLARLKDHILLWRVSWDTYDALLDECADRRLRHTFDRGSLEFMTRPGVHEVYKSLLGQFVVILAEVPNQPLFLGGELTLRRFDVDRGLESDQCYWIANEPRVRGKTAIDLAVDPPPDLFIEIEVSRTTLDRIAVAAVLGVREVWRFAGTNLQIGLLQPGGQYAWGTTSHAFPGIRIGEIVGFLQTARTTGHLDVLRAFRAWVRNHVAAQP